MKTLCIVTAAIEAGAGIALLGFPSAVVALLVGAPLESSAGLTVARVGGAGLLALGLACWLARNDTRSHAGRGLVAAILLYNIAAVAILAYAGIGLRQHGMALWPAVALHALMAVWCAAAMKRNLS